MRDGQNTIPIGKNRFPGVVAFVENFDTNEDDNEPADILSFESLRDAFATIQSVETECAEIGFSTEEKPREPEHPNYELDDAIDSEYENDLPPSNVEPSLAVGTRLETIVEAMLFVGNQENRPLPAEQIAEKLRNVSVEDVEQAVIHLNECYQKQNCPYSIIFERGGYQMALRLEFESVRDNFYGKVREVRLSQQAIDTLAVVAYRQPITADEVQALRRQSCSTVLNQLVRRNLLRISREVLDKKSVVRYHTTSRFLELLQIKSLDEVPRVDELDHT